MGVHTLDTESLVFAGWFLIEEGTFMYVALAVAWGTLARL